MGKKPPKPVEWIWVRHLRALGVDGIVCGRLDPPADLSDPAPAAALAGVLPRDALVLSSPLARCRQTLAAIRRAGGPAGEPETVPDFLEQSFGDWEGRRYADVPEMSAWTITDYALRAPPGGESFADLCVRVAGAIERRNAAVPELPVVVCAHAGVVQAALAHALNLAPATALAFAIDCASVTRITCIGPNDRRVEQVNARV